MDPTSLGANSYIIQAIDQGKKNALSTVKSMELFSKDLFFETTLIDEEVRTFTFRGKSHSVEATLNTHAIENIKRNTNKQKLLTLALAVTLITITTQIAIGVSPTELILTDAPFAIGIAYGLFLMNKQIEKDLKKFEEEVKNKIIEKFTIKLTYLRQQQADSIKKIITFDSPATKHDQLHISLLATDMLRHTFAYIDIEELKSCSITCRHMFKSIHSIANTLKRVQEIKTQLRNLHLSSRKPLTLSMPMTIPSLESSSYVNYIEKNYLGIEQANASIIQHVQKEEDFQTLKAYLFLGIDKDKAFYINWESCDRGKAVKYQIFIKDLNTQAQEIIALTFFEDSPSELAEQEESKKTSETQYDIFIPNAIIDATLINHETFIAYNMNNELIFCNFKISQIRKIDLRNYIAYTTEITGDHASRLSDFLAHQNLKIAILGNNLVGIYSRPTNFRGSFSLQAAFKLSSLEIILKNDLPSLIESNNKSHSNKYFYTHNNSSLQIFNGLSKNPVSQFKIDKYTEFYLNDDLLYIEVPYQNRFRIIHLPTRRSFVLDVPNFWNILFSKDCSQLMRFNAVVSNTNLEAKDITYMHAASELKVANEIL